MLSSSDNLLQMNFKTRLFVILWVAGVVGVLSFLLVDLKALLSRLGIASMCGKNKGAGISIR